MHDTEAIPILLVDDSAGQRAAVRALLSRRPGLAVEEAESGREALEKAMRADYACILLDVRMPGLDGFEVAEALRERVRDPFLPIIFLSGAPAPDSHLKRGYALGAVDFVSYPLVPEVFLAKLEVFLRLSLKTHALDRHAARLDDQVRKRSAELEYQSRLARTLAEHSASALFLLDGRMRAVFVNPAVERITGFPRQEALGKPIQALLPSADPASLASLALPEAIAAHPHARHLEGVFLRKNGSEYQGQCTVTRLVLEDGSRGAVVELRDVSDRKGAERVLKESEEKLYQARRLETAGQLAGGVAHEFDAILAAILGHCAVGLERPGLDAEVSANLAGIRSAAERASRLTRVLLAYNREEGPEVKQVDLNACISENLVLLAALAGGRAQLILELDPEAGRIRSDRGWIRQILAVLVRNARDAMPQGGAIRLRTSRTVASGRGAAGGGRQCVLSVGDTGGGMTPQIRARIFEPFFTTKPGGRGEGMGLAMVDGLVQQCGGRIEVDSAPDRGTFFHLYFPEAVPSAGPAAPRLGADPGNAAEAERREPGTGSGPGARRE